MYFYCLVSLQPPGKRQAYLLRVCSALELSKVAVGVNSPQEDWFELIHSSIGKEQGGVIVGDHAAGGHLGVALGLEELYEGCSDPVTCKWCCTILLILTLSYATCVE